MLCGVEIMQTLYQNKQPVYYAQYNSTTQTLDGDGNVSKNSATYTKPVKIMANVSFVRGSIDSSRGRAHLNEYGVDEGYVATLIVDDMTCPIDETSVLWINRPTTEAHNFVVYRRLPSLNSISLLCKQVSVV